MWPREDHNLSDGCTIFIFWNGPCVEEYVDDFTASSHQAFCSDLTLTEGFRVGLDEEIQMMMPLGDPNWSLAQYLNFALWIAGASYLVGEKEDPPAPDPSPQLLLIQTHLIQALHLP